MKGVLIVAEAGVNHNGSVALAKKLVDAAARAGADAVKFQTFEADRLVTRRMPRAEYQEKAMRGNGSQWQMIKRLELDGAAHRILFGHCRKRNIEFLSSPFDEESVDRLRRLGVRRLKIASGEITNAPLLLKAARTGIPIILSTGMSTLKEVERALEVIAFGYLAPLKKNPARGDFDDVLRSEKARGILRQKLILLHCTSEYPAPFRDVNLLAMDTLREKFGLAVGLSDHSEGYAVPVAAAARGARVIEKHLTLDRRLPGPDHRASLPAAEFKKMVRAIRQVELALGTAAKSPAPSELKNIPAVRKSIVAAFPIGKGERFSPENLALKRAGRGLSPFLYWDVLGRVSKRDFEKDEAVTL